jgi:hypothetical protein
LRESREFCYVAWGARHVKLAARSARSARAHTPGVRIVAHVSEPPTTEDSDAFDEIIVDDAPPDAIGRKQLKAKALLKSAADATLFLDCDTLVGADLTEIFTLLESCDIAAAIDPTRTIDIYQRYASYRLPAVEASAPFLNCGVIGLRRSERTRKFLQDWYDGIKADDVPRDQWTFRRLVYDSDIRLRVLPPEFNTRVLGPVALSGPVRILHMYDLPQYTAFEVLDFLNSWTGKRVFTPHDGRLLEHSHPSNVRYRYLKDFKDGTVYRESPKLSFGQHLRDLFPSLGRSISYRLFSHGLLGKLAPHALRPRG